MFPPYNNNEKSCNHMCCHAILCSLPGLSKEVREKKGKSNPHSLLASLTSLFLFSFFARNDFLLVFYVPILSLPQCSILTRGHHQRKARKKK
jgi:hypothetical protein